MSTNRVPAIAPSDLTADQKQLYDELSDTASSFFKDAYEHVHAYS